MEFIIHKVFGKAAFLHFIAKNQFFKHFEYRVLFHSEMIVYCYFLSKSNYAEPTLYIPYRKTILRQKTILKIFQITPCTHLTNKTLLSDTPNTPFPTGYFYSKKESSSSKTST